MRKTLTAKMVDALAPDPNGKRYDVMDAAVPNLGVRVLPTGTKTVPRQHQWHRFEVVI